MSRVQGWLLGLLCAMALPVQAQTVEYIHTDALGTPVAVTDVNRTVIERSEYEPYGALLNRPISDGPGYTGHVIDAVTGLSYMQQRYYEPTLGRFLSVDPVTADSNTGGNFNRYWYANNNPYKFTDPDGRISRCGVSCDDERRDKVGQPGGPAFQAGAQSAVPTMADVNRQPSPGRRSSLERGISNAWDGLVNGILPALGPEGPMLAGGAKMLGAGALAVRLGKVGEDAVRAAYSIGGRQLITINGRLRIPDGMNAAARTLSEVKNVQSLSFTRQLRDYSDFARANGLQFDLYVRPGAQLSGPLEAAIKAGDITLRAIP